MCVIVFCPTIMSTANPIYETLKYLDKDDIIMDYSDEKLLSKLDEIEKEKMGNNIVNNLLKKEISES